jgi:hypothetical protein
MSLEQVVTSCHRQQEVTASALWLCVSLSVPSFVLLHVDLFYLFVCVCHSLVVFKNVFR